MKNYIQLILILVVSMVSISAQNISVSNDSNNPVDTRILAYFKAFNTGDEKVMGDYFSANISAESLKQRPVEQRLQFYRQVRDDTQKVAIKRVAKINDNETKVSAQSTNGDWFSFTFIFESQPPNKLAGVSVERGDEPDESGAPGGSSADKNQPPLTETEFVAETGNYLDELVKNDEFSGVVLIAKNDKPIYSRAFGLANKDTKIPNQIDTKFNLGSINKSFTQIAIGQLVKQGEISLDDRLGKYLPDYPNKEAAEKITIRHLLSMTSGVGDIFGDKYFATPKENLRNISDFIPLFSGKPLAFEPGTKNQYSNGGYILLGAIVEKVTGKSYYDYVRENIYQPLGMTSTAFYESDKPPPNIAEGYTKQRFKAGDNAIRRSNFDTRPARGSSAGGGYSTAEDLLKFSLALQTGKVQSPEFSPGAKDPSGKFMGLGIAGGSPGINAALEIMPESGYTIIVLSNYDPPSAEKAARQLRNFLGRVKK